ncbi:hypothetical protein [Microbacterium sp.]|uniref:hypothetical protein n=1 Tax=Microbacterium sp. TaxID=51671 RepID=UPI002811E29A|nr:hypothetical protein [Microbacterium sp.]
MSRLVRAADVGAVDDGSRIYAAVLPDGPIFVLADDAAEVWRAVERRDGDIPAADENVAALVQAGLLTLEEDT